MGGMGTKNMFTVLLNNSMEIAGTSGKKTSF